MDTLLVFCRKSPALAIFFRVPGQKDTALAAFRRSIVLVALSLAVVLPLTVPPSAQAARIISAKDRAEGDAFYQQAYAAYVAGDHARALSLLDQADKLKPDQADGLNLRGIVCMKQGAYDQAEAAFSRAVALDPNLWAAQFNLGEIPFRKKDFARARSRFERLLSQTNRFQEKNQWELVQYKVFLSCLLAGNEADAQKKFEKIPATGGVTPAYQYAQAAAAFAHKDAPGAARWLSQAQTAFPPAMNALFSGSLATAGWINPLPAAGDALTTNGEKTNARRYRPTAAYIDPRLESAVAEPLPAPDGDMLPMLPSPVPPGRAAAPPLPSPPPAPTQQNSGLDNGGLLLVH
jgi:Tfp pilus assembly protein PilF